ncbi:MAG: sodium/proton-translocating pyrophosphatase [Bacteroidales bacterium]
MGNILYYLIAAAFIGLAYSYWKSYQINRLEPGTPTTSNVTKSIRVSTITFLKAEYKFALLAGLAIAILLYFKGKSETDSNWLIVGTYILGAGLSALTGYLQLQVSLKTNEKVTIQSQNSYGAAYSKAFYGGISIGLIGISFVVIGLSGLLLALNFIGKNWETSTLLNVIAGFTLGASTISLFTRMGGSIFAKSADLTEAYVVKNEQGIKDKSLYNPVSYANDAGQNINNVAGIGSDLYESLSIALIASMMLGLIFLDSNAIVNHFEFGPLLVPLIITAIGIFTSVGASYLLNAKEKTASKKAIALAEGSAALILLGGAFMVTKFLLPLEWDVETKTSNELITTTYKSLGIFWSALIGIIGSVGIAWVTDLYVASKSKSVKKVIDNSFAGPAGNILGGFEQGFISTGIPILIILAVAIGSYYFAGFYGIGIASVGMLSNMGLQNAINAFAPITDNANTIAIKSGLTEQTINQTNNLRISGLEALARSKGYLTLSAVVSVIALLFAFMQVSGTQMVDLKLPLIVAGLFVGVTLPVILSSNILAAVNRVSRKLLNETNRQFEEIHELNAAKEILDKYNGDLTYATEGEKEIVKAAEDSADYQQCVEVGAYSTIWETLITTGVLFLVTILIGYLAGAEILASFLLGGIAAGTVLSLFYSTSGSQWESAKIGIEGGVEHNGEFYGKESMAYQASLAGEKTGKPLKDSVSPALNVMMKVIIVIAIILAPAFKQKTAGKEKLEVNNKYKIESKIR